MPEAASTTAEKGGKPRRSRPIALYLFVLALVALVPAFTFSAILLQRNNEAQERVVEALIVGTSRSIVQAVEREIVANITTLRVLATAPTLLQRDFRSFHARVAAALDYTGASIYLLDSDFMSIMSTRTEYGAPPVPSSDPEAARRAFENNGIVVSDLVVGAVSQRRVINILMPVPLEEGEPMLIGFNRDADQLAPALLANKLPAGWHVALVDRKGDIIAASPGGGRTGDPFLLAGADSLASSSGWSQLGDSEYQAVVQRSPLTGWTLVAWAPRELITQPLAEAFGSLLVGGVLLAALVIIIIYWVSLQIGRSVRDLEADARRLGAGEEVPVRAYPITEIANVAAAIGDASHRRKAAETEVRFLMRELAHRSKNQMTVIAAMAKQTARGASSVPEFVHSFEKRIHGLASSTDLLLAHGVAGVDLRELLSHQIDPFCPVDSDRVVLAGPAVRLNTQAAQILGMAGHELATNAVKYGAFAGEYGRLRVEWRREGGVLALHWRETAGPLPDRKHRRGFGTTVLENMVGRSLGAEVERQIHADGIEWRFRIPVSAIDPKAPPHGPEPGEPARPADRPEAAPAAAAGQEK
jgi:two-component sensor histidine kinase